MNCVAFRAVGKLPEEQHITSFSFIIHKFMAEIYFIYNIFKFLHQFKRTHCRIAKRRVSPKIQQKPAPNSLSQVMYSD